jgi:hypothetical protein
MTSRITVEADNDVPLKVLLTTIDDKGVFQSQTEETVAAGKKGTFDIHRTLKIEVIEQKKPESNVTARPATEMNPAGAAAGDEKDSKK